MTKIAFGIDSPQALCRRLDAQRESWGEEARITTRYRPTRHEELTGGSLFWILEHALIGRSPILGFEQREEDGRWWIRLSPQLIAVQNVPRRAHQGWRYLKDEDAPGDLPEGEDRGDVLPGPLLGRLAKLGLV